VGDCSGGKKRIELKGYFYRTVLPFLLSYMRNRQQFHLLFVSKVDAGGNCITRGERVSSFCEALIWKINFKNIFDMLSNKKNER